MEFTKQFIDEFDDLLQTGIMHREVEILQIPHHGAKGNWSGLEKASINSNIYVISFGLGNPYHHPHKDVIRDLFRRKNQVYFANQIEDFEYFIY